ncbi:DUF488 domain-containing protein [Ferdinandcohnia sp. Marseille-Q9671]
MIKNLVLKRIYEQANEEDGKRILVDRIWPRGISKEYAKLDTWMKEIAPSTELRKEFNHKPERFQDFKEHYIEELRSEVEKRQAINVVLQMLKDGKVTLLYGAKDEKHNHATVLQEVLQEEKENF